MSPTRLMIHPASRKEPRLTVSSFTGLKYIRRTARYAFFFREFLKKFFEMEKTTYLELTTFPGLSPGGFTRISHTEKSE